MKTFWQIVLIAFIVFVAIKVRDHFFPNTQVITQTVTDTIFESDTIYQDSIVYVDVPVPTKPDTIVEVHMDTLQYLPDSGQCLDAFIQLWQRHFNQYFYYDTIVNNEDLFIQFGEVITQNQPIYRNVAYEIRRPTIINNNTHIHNQREFYLGMEFGVQTFQPTFTYESLNNFQYSVGYDLVGQERGFRFGIHSRLSNLWEVFK